MTARTALEVAAGLEEMTVSRIRSAADMLISQHAEIKRLKTQVTTVTDELEACVQRVMEIPYPQDGLSRGAVIRAIRARAEK